mgnify:CR=1 FL=1
MGGVVSAAKSIVSSAKAVVLKNVAAKGGWKGLLSGGLKQFAFSFIASAVLSFAFRKLAGKPKQPDFNSFTNGMVGQLGIVGFLLYGRKGLTGGVLLSVATGLIDALLFKTGEETLKSL